MTMYHHHRLERHHHHQDTNSSNTPDDDSISPSLKYKHTTFAIASAPLCIDGYNTRFDCIVFRKRNLHRQKQQFVAYKNKQHAHTIQYSTIQYGKVHFRYNKVASLFSFTGHRDGVKVQTCSRTKGELTTDSKGVGGANMETGDSLLDEVTTPDESWN